MQQCKPVPIQQFWVTGGRFSGKSTAIQVLVALACFIQGISVGIVFFRASKDGAKDLLDDIIATLENFAIPYSVNRSASMIYINKVKIRVIGLNSMSKYGAKKSGLPRFANVDYIIKIFEECFEFRVEEFNAINEAVRHIGKEPSYLTFCICNPWALTNWFIKRCVDLQKHDEKVLKEVGYQLGVYEIHDKETNMKQKILVEYSNWRVVREHISQEQIMNIRNYWKTDRNRALVADYGMPGFEFGAIYTSELHKIAEPFYSADPCYHLCGMDYGWSQTEGHGKTACIFATGTPNNGVDIYGEFIWDNSKVPIDPNQLCQRVVNFYKEQVQTWMQNLNHIYPPKINVRVDNSEPGIIALLNNTARQYGYNTWLSFGPCKKYPTMDRISVVLALMGCGKFRMSKQCDNLMKEFSFAHYDEKGEKKRVKENDHSLNALEYGIEPLLYKWPSELGMDMKLFKRRI